MIDWAHTTVVIPFRLASARFPRKALAHFHGSTLLEHALAKARALGAGRRVLTAPGADLDEVRRVLDLTPFDVTLMPTSATCASATERVVELFPQLDGDPIISLPVDEPALDPLEIRRALEASGVSKTSGVSEAARASGASEAITFYCPFFAEEDYRSRLSAKLVLDSEGYLLYMSRATIPLRKDGEVEMARLKKNVGVFVFPRAFLAQLLAQSAIETTLDSLEGLEQLRWLELGLKVRCLQIRHIGFGIDVPEQVPRLVERLA